MAGPDAEPESCQIKARQETSPKDIEIEERPLRMNLTLIDKIVLAADGTLAGLRVAEIDWLPDDFEALKNDVLILINDNDGSDVSNTGHGTHWTTPLGHATQYNILSNHGEYHNTYGGGYSIHGKRFPEPDKYPHLAKFVWSFKHAINMRINVFGGKSGLSQHKETVVVRQKSGKRGRGISFANGLCGHPRLAAR